MYIYRETDRESVATSRVEHVIFLSRAIYV